MIINDMAIGYDDATTTTSGLMSASDKTKLDGVATGATAVTTTTVSGWGYTKNTGTVTSVSGTGVLSGTVTTSGSISHNTSGVTAGTYGSTTAVPVVTVNATGHVTGMSTATISGGLPSVTTADNGKALLVVDGVWAKGEIREKQPIGGRIFYDAGANGLTYTFYDASGNVLTTQTVAGLANATTYICDGTATPRWYVYDTTGITSGLYWGYYGTSTGAKTNSIGSGTTNTATVLGLGVPTDYTPNIWSFIKGKRDASYNGCDDWFIASEAEQDQLRSSGLVAWHSSYNIWSSVEDSSDYAYRWLWSGSTWGNVGKTNRNCAFAARAF